MAKNKSQVAVEAAATAAVDSIAAVKTPHVFTGPESVEAPGAGEVAEVVTHAEVGEPALTVLRNSEGVLDPTTIPEFAYDGTTKRRLRQPGMYYRWGRFDKVPFHIAAGYRHVMYDDMVGNLGLYEKSADGHIHNGDVVLLQISERGRAANRAMIENRNRLQEAAVRRGFSNDLDNLNRSVPAASRRAGARLEPLEDGK